MSAEDSPIRRVGPASHELARALGELCARFGLAVVHLAPGTAIPGSYWGAPEAGLRGPSLFVRADTPLHSALHEACHFLCMDPDRRARLDTDAGGDDLEEGAVCYLSILLADRLPAYGRDTMLADMDDWGYSFRLGSARAWFERDAEDARQWLVRHLGRDQQGAAQAGVLDERDVHRHARGQRGVLGFVVEGLDEPAGA